MLFSFSLEESLKRAHASPLFKVHFKGKGPHGVTDGTVGGDTRPAGGWGGAWCSSRDMLLEVLAGETRCASGALRPAGCRECAVYLGLQSAWPGIT